MLLRYLGRLNSARVVLWCYLLWYIATAVRCFDASLGLWLTSVGLSAIIGFGLFLSTTQGTNQRTALGRWQVFRLFLMPFCVSSFAALIKGKGYLLIFSPNWQDNVQNASICMGFVVLTWLSKHLIRPVQQSSTH